MAARDARFTPAFRGGSGSPMVCLHGFTGTWRIWDLVLPALTARHDVLAPTLPGHAGGPRLDGAIDLERILDALEAAMDDAGFDTAHLVGNSLGGYLALRLAGRGRGRTVTALAPAGGWAEGDDSYRETMRYFVMMSELVRQAAPQAEAIAASPEGRRRATESIAENAGHIPAQVVADIIRGAAGCDAVRPMVRYATEHGYPFDPEEVTCPVRIVWGAADRLLPWPATAARFRESWLPHADWVVLDGVGHCPQVDVPLETAELILGFAALHG